MSVACSRGRDLILVHGDSRVDIHGIVRSFGGHAPRAKVTRSELEDIIKRMHIGNLDDHCMHVFSGLKNGFAPLLVFLTST